MRQEINELISRGPAAPGWKQLDLLLQTELHPPQENRKSPFLIPPEEEGHRGGGGGRAFILTGTKAGSCFPNPPWGAAAGGARVGKAEKLEEYIRELSTSACAHTQGFTGKAHGGTWCTLLLKSYLPCTQDMQRFYTE